MYADLVMTRAQFQLYLGKYDKAADDLVHAIETSKPEHAAVLKKVCIAVQSKTNKNNLTEACTNLANGNIQIQTASTTTASQAIEQAQANAASAQSADAFDLPKSAVEFKGGETSKTKRILLRGINAEQVRCRCEV